ncbi:glycerol acyltransferase [Sphingobacterium olei]|uniref:Glycerol acyltransferase n=1 Tax=Sphingobacterium olei TaxID=2571155 RepID=A0A4V5MNL2_9SPHI|nr:1-acyl-sn-glycerol-3-phosphate acyltransferase [Sphingobacterium olei]TJZ61908.1 glycerol acyltransferase [Sphingobacterium olei]
MHNVFYHIYCWVQRNRFFSCGVTALFLFISGYLASQIRFEEDITQIIPKSEKSNLTTRAIQQINFSDKITVLLEKGDEGSVDDVVSLAQEIADTLSQDTLYISEIIGQISNEDLRETYDFVFQNLPVFLTSTDYDSIAKKIAPAAIKAKAIANYQTLISPTGFVAADFIQKDPLGLAVLGLSKLQEINVGEHFILYNGFVTSRDSSAVLLFLTPKYTGVETEHNKAFTDELYTTQQRLNVKYQNKANVSYFGSTLVAVANADQIKSDIAKTVLISMSILMILLVIFYRRIYIPLLVFIPTIFAGLFALACIYVYKPVISAISISIGAVLIGITIDYALHVLTHYKKNTDVKALYKELTKPLIMSGATTSVAFLCLLFVHSDALIDLGIFAAITVFSSAIFTLLIIPHLYSAKKELIHNSFIDKIAAFPFERSKALIGVCLLLIFVSFFTSRNITFNDDLSALNYIPTDLKEVEQKLDKLTNSSAKSLYAVATGNTLDTALDRNAEVANLLLAAKERGEVISFSNSNTLLRSARDQRQQIAEWNSFWQYHNKKALERQLQREGAAYGFNADAHQEFYNLLAKDFTPLTYSDFQDVPNIGLKDFVANKGQFFTVSSLVKLEEVHRKEVIRSLELLEGVVVVDRKQLNETYLGKLRDDFNSLVGYSFVAVLLILWFFFKRIELVLLASIPIGLTGLVTAGLMGIFGLEFNIFSAIVCTLIFGHGVDFSIFMTTALQKQYSTGKDELQIYRTSILLAVLTTVLAIGALIFAKHPALISISSVSLIGVFAAVIITFVFYPILFRFFISDRAKKGKSPFTLTILLFSILLFAYYGLGCLIMSGVGRFIFPLLPIGKERQKSLFRSMTGTFMKSVLYFHPLTRKKTLNLYRENFKKPAVIIANHSSFLDTLTMGMLIPKMIVLVNDWVWRSPIFGNAVQALGFYPISKGVEESLDFIRQKVEDGFSVVVFPEGTRSYDNRIRRFHKGAFYLAEQLKMDILPVYIHGNGDVLPKGDFMIFGGKLTYVIGKRIAIDDFTFGVSYPDRTKIISAYFRQEYTILRRELEDENYFISKINIAYLYKDQEIMQSVRLSLETNKMLFYDLNAHISGQYNVVVHISDTYGELDYLLSLQDGARKLVGVIADQEKREVANSIYWKQHRCIRFEGKIELGDILLISCLLRVNEIAAIDFAGFSNIINVNTLNDFDFLIQQGFEKNCVGNKIELYKKVI